MLKPVSIQKTLFACRAFCPADTQTRQLARLLYETIWIIDPRT